jgi:predicted DCC family thiol-disulfide oxidoreductase YuxK
LTLDPELRSARRETAAGRHLILYDRDCGFCRWSLGWLLRWDRRRALVPVALQDPLSERLLADLDRDARLASWHLISPAGERVSGGIAIAPMLNLLPAGAPLGRLLGAFPAATERAYAFVTRHRGAIGRRVPAGARARAGEVIARRELVLNRRDRGSGR